MENLFEKIKRTYNPKVKSLTKGTYVQNAVGSGKYKPVGGGAWKDFWQKYSEENFPSTCPFCGKPLDEEEIHGCHILIGQESNSNKEYIIPGHEDCNHQFGKYWQLKRDIKAVEAINE